MSTSTASFDIDARTDRGRQRSNNQDSIGRADQWTTDRHQPIDRALRERYGRLYIVADGVGGNADGADASRMVVDEVMRVFYFDPAGVLPEEPVERLRAAIEHANNRVHAEAQRRRNNMASTIVAALIHNDTLTIANVGDSPAFLCRNGQSPQRLTKAHIRREADGSTALAQAMGDPRVYPAVFSLPLQQGDAVVLCSDGLTDLVQPTEIAEIVNGKTASAATRALIALANRRGGHDNISAIVVRNAPPPVSSVSPHMSKRLRLLIISLPVAILLAVFVIALPFLNPLPDTGGGAVRPTAAAQNLVIPGSHNNPSDLAQLPTVTLGALPTATDTPTPAPTRQARPTMRPTLISATPVTTTVVTEVSSADNPSPTQTPELKMPNVIGKSRSDAEQIIKDVLKVAPVIEEVRDDSATPSDHVVATEPRPGEPVRSGVPIKLRIKSRSSSAPPDHNPAPNNPPSAPDKPPSPPDNPPAPSATPTPGLSAPAPSLTPTKSPGPSATPTTPSPGPSPDNSGGSGGSGGTGGGSGGTGGTGGSGGTGGGSGN